MNKFSAFVTTSLVLLGQRVDSKDKGASMVEYGLLVALIAVVVIVAVTLIGTNLSDLFNNVATKI